MSELEKIQRSLSEYDKQAYKDAVANGGACILIGKKVCMVYADGQIEVLKELDKANVILKERNFALS